MPTKKKKPKPSTTRYNWPALKAEWLQRTLGDGTSLNKFREEKGIGNKGLFYERVEQDGWLADRDRLVTTALQKAEVKAMDNLTDKYSLQGQIYDIGEKQLAFWLQQNVDPATRTFKRAVDPTQVAAVMLGAYRALVAKRLLDNRPTSINANVDYTKALVELTKALKDKNPEVINSTHTIPNLDQLPGGDPEADDEDEAG